MQQNNLKMNPFLKRFEKYHSRGFSKKLALQDTFYRLMRRSDPIIQASISCSANLIEVHIGS